MSSASKVDFSTLGDELRRSSVYRQTAGGIWLPSLGGSFGQTAVSLVDPTTGSAVAIAAGPTASYRINSSANTNNAAQIKGSGTYVFGVRGQNANAAARYLKLYNKTGTPAPASDVALVVLPLAGSAVFNFQLNGMAFPTGLGVALVTGAADNDNTSVSAADILACSIDYVA